ncbi:MAG TPA: gamma-glutamyltransferase [Trueperaceae bacterium]|nr:gamma-glutamyltransferase [Trueperaceae bacterium]
MKGIVAAPQPAAAELGARIMEEGGNAFDAAVAAGFMQMVTDPFMCGLGGWGSATVYQAETGKFEHIGFWARIGAKMRPDMWVDDVKGFTDLWRFPLFDDHRSLRGYTSIMTPGTVAGFGEIHSRYATKPWAELLAPSIAVSRDGFRIPEYVAEHVRLPMLPELPHPKDKYAVNKAARDLFHGDDGYMLETGHFYRNPDQAQSLERIATNGARDFYTGGLAERILADFEANDAFVTREDLANYRPVVEPPLKITYRGHEVASSAVPGGGLLTLQILNVLEQFDLSQLDHNGPEHGYIVAAALAWAGVTRGKYLADPRFADVPVHHLLSKEYAAEVADAIRRHELPDRKMLNKPGFTTHISVIDEDGNCVSITHTLTTCAGIVVPGTGFTWNNCVSLMDPIPGRPNSYEPGKARASAISPSVILKDGKPWAAVGAPGGWSISSAVSQAISNMIDFGMTPVEAVSAPRFHSEGDPVYCELRVPQRTVEELRRRGMNVQQSLRNYERTFAKVQIAARTASGYAGASDPRKDGGAVAIAR